jgi:hypothetical protein
MSFAKRAINIRFLLNNDVLSSNNTNTLDLTGYQCELTVSNPGAVLVAQTLQMHIYGMSPADMNQFSTDGLNALSVRDDQVIVSAGDVGGNIRQIFAGTITAAFSDYSGMPDVAFVVSAQAAFFHKIQPSNANSFKGEADVATIISGLCKQIGFTPHNNGVNTSVTDQYLKGSIIEQINKICDIAGIACAIEGTNVYIWPNSGTRDNQTFTISPENGRVGYPTFTPMGIQVKTLFNSDLQTGRQIIVKSSIPKAAKDDWVVQNATHDLSTLTNDGPWFTIINLVKRGYALSNVY